MQVFDRIDPATLDRRDTQLWVLAIAMIVILAASVALLMYPAIFAMPVVLSGPLVRRIFVSFCVLSLLVVGYLMDRRFVVNGLRRRLVEEQARARRMLNEASAELLNTLPGIEHFRDRLAMEFRRTVNAQLPLSLILVGLKASDHLGDSNDALTAYGDAAKAMVRKLRGEDSIYCFRPGVFGVVLPGVRASDAARVGDRLAEGLTDASGAGARFSFIFRVVGYPESVTTAHEMERAAISFSSQEDREIAAA